jgi:hypothetical protein
MSTEPRRVPEARSRNNMWLWAAGAVLLAVLAFAFWPHDQTSGRIAQNDSALDGSRTDLTDPAAPRAPSGKVTPALPSMPAY